MRSHRSKRCNRANKVAFATELDAKMALARRVWKDRGEVRYYACHGHYHLTSEEARTLTTVSKS